MNYWLRLKRKKLNYLCNIILCMSNTQSNSKSVSIENFVNAAKAKLASTPADRSSETFLCGYVLGKSIGHGSYAVVKLAFSPKYKKAVAVKIITKKNASPTFLDQFLPREIDVVKRLEHKNIIHYYQCIETTHRFLIVMEYAPNGNLLDLLSKKTFFREAVANKFFSQLADAIEYCHRHDVVHRDLKLENLFLDKRHDVKIGDFGFGRRMNPPSERDVVEEKPSQHSSDSDLQRSFSRTFCGSNAYASPEILKSIPYDPKYSDVWATGVCLYAMVFGSFPFDDRSYRRLLKQVDKPVVFQDQPTISDKCKELIRLLIAPIEQRLSMAEVNKHDWVAGKQSAVEKSVDVATETK